MKLRYYVARRLLLLIPTLIGLTLIVFILSHVGGSQRLVGAYINIHSTVAVVQTQVAILQSDLGQIGVPLAVQGVTYAEILTFTNTQNTPSLLFGGWGPDWPDPVLCQIYPLLTPNNAPTSLMNVTQASQLINSLVFQTDQTKYIQGIAQLYNITYNYAPFIWLPNYDNYVLLQPYVHGMVYSPFTTVLGQFYYNTFYYSSS